MFALLGVSGLSALFGLLAISTRSPWVGSERRDFESAVPLNDPEAILPAPRESMRRCFPGPFAVIVALPTLLFGLLCSGVPGQSVGGLSSHRNGSSRACIYSSGSGATAYSCGAATLRNSLWVRASSSIPRLGSRHLGEFALPWRSAQHRSCSAGIQR